MRDATNATIRPRFRIHFERDLRQPIETVWKAISDEHEVAAWMGFPTRLEPALGGRIFIDFSPEEPLTGIVCAAEPHKRLAYTWGDDLIKWELLSTDGILKLAFSHNGVRPEFVIGLSAGWHGFLDSLEAHLTGETVPDRFEERYAIYEKEIGPMLAR